MEKEKTVNQSVQKLNGIVNTQNQMIEQRIDGITKKLRRVTNVNEAYLRLVKTKIFWKVQGKYISEASNGPDVIFLP